MSAAAFAKLLQNGVYTTWLGELKYIANTSTDILRPKEQTKEKTDFLINRTKLQEMFQLMTGTIGLSGGWEPSNAKLSEEELKAMFASIAGRTDANVRKVQPTITGTPEELKIGLPIEVSFEGVTFETIGNIVKTSFDSLKGKSAKAIAEGRLQVKNQYRRDITYRIQSLKTIEDLEKEAEEDGFDSSGIESMELSVFTLGDQTSSNTPRGSRQGKYIPAPKILTENQKKAYLKRVLDKIEIDFENETRFGIGYFYHKSHAIAIGTNLTISYRNKLQEHLTAWAGIDAARLLTMEEVLKGVDFYIDHLLKADRARMSPEMKILVDAKYTQTTGAVKDYKYLVTMGIATENMEAGRETQGILSEFKRMASGKDMVAILGGTVTAKDLAIVQGSTPFLDIIGEDVARIIGNKKLVSKTKTIPNTLVNTTKIKNTAPKGPNPKIAQLKSVATKLKAAIAKAKAARNKPISTVARKPTKSSSIIRAVPINLSALQGLINQHLQNVISANMGDGSQRNILNYRTGRFAGSTKVESMSQSRAGMITAFYSYMKNPYATFAEGGNQENPRTRNPKLLISKSIREIAMGKVGNRLRAVAL